MSPLSLCLAGTSQTLLDLHQLVLVCLSIQLVFLCAVEIYPSWMQSYKDMLEKVSHCLVQWQ